MLLWLRASTEWDLCTGSKGELLGSTNVCDVRAIMSEFGSVALETKEQLNSMKLYFRQFFLF